MCKYEGSNIVLKLVSLCGTQSGKQSCKRKLRDHDWHQGSNIYQDLFDLWWNSKWQAKVMRMRHDMLLHSLKLGRLVIWDEYYCTKKASKRKVNETWVDVYMLSQIGKFAYEIKW